MSESPREAPDRLRRAEAIIQHRTGRFAVVLERVTDSHNISAVLRSAEAMGIQDVYVVEPPVPRNESCKPLAFAKKITKNVHKWLSVQSFPTTTECIRALRAGGYAIWCTDLSREAVNCDDRSALLPMPQKVAVVIGRESDGVSAELLAAADKRIFLPMFGFTESYNLSVACALMLQRLFDACPEARGDLSKEARASLRRSWFEELSRNPTARANCESFLTSPERVVPLEDLRRPDKERETWAPPKIKKREAQVLAGGARPAFPDPAGAGAGKSEPAQSKNAKRSRA